MARFRASIDQIDKPEVHRFNDDWIDIRVEGWDFGVSVVAYKGQNGADGFVIRLTGGSNHTVEERTLARVVSPNGMQDTEITVFGQDGKVASKESPAIV